MESKNLDFPNSNVSFSLIIQGSPIESSEGATYTKQDNDYSYYENNNNKIKENPSQDYLSDFKDSVYATNSENIYGKTAR